MSMTVQILVFHIAGTIDNCTEQQLLVHVRAIQLDYIQELASDVQDPKELPFELASSD
jgi:hypothetical protein